VSEAGLVRVWDPVVRIGHWTLAALFAASYATGDVATEIHTLIGYALASVVALRVLWGFAGTRHARFASFLRGPRATLDYLRLFAAGRPPHYLGHNPAGGWMIVLLLAMLAATAWTGLETYGSQGHGPLAVPASEIQAQAANQESREHRPKRRRSARERFWKELHEGCVDATLVLVLLHITGALVASLVHRENLLRAMVTGDKRDA
jgi:cytochrome b